MSFFKEGKRYECNDCGISPVLIVKRTSKMCLVENDTGNQWRMKIRQVDDDEIMIDSTVPKRWRDVYTYNAKYEVK